MRWVVLALAVVAGCAHPAAKVRPVAPVTSLAPLSMPPGPGCYRPPADILHDRIVSPDGSPAPRVSMQTPWGCLLAL